MNDYPNHFPPFMRDFHDQKNLCKAFYTWLTMMENRMEARDENAFLFSGRRTDMCGWIDFNILLASFVDFLNTNGWRIYRARDRQEHADINESVEELNNLEHAWGEIHDPILLTREQCIEQIEAFEVWLPFMPEHVRLEYEKAVVKL